MTTRQGLPRGISVFLTSVVILSSTNFAHASSRSCSYLLDPIQSETLKTLREKNTEFLQREIKAHPLPGFDYIEKEIKNEQIGFIGPRALQQMLGPDMSFIRTPAPSAPLDTAVNMHEEGRSFVVHLDIPHHGVRTSTAVYASMPKTYKPTANGYLVGTDYPVAQVHLHGGGTPTATGKNGMSIGQALAVANIPVLAIDLPGHGRATRQIDGFTTFKENIDWILKITDKLIDPAVKIDMSGHSWGGEFTAYWRRLTRDPKYRSRIARFITVSPPIDVTLGGSDSESDKFDEWFERNYQSFEEQAAPGDYEFMKNSVRNGKTSTVGGLFTTFTHMDYKMPPLTDADRAELLPEDAFEGESDILTWLGRAKQGLIQFGKDLTVLTAGLTWKSKDENDLQKTGHNVWDLLIKGTKTLFMYDFMTRKALEVAGPQGMGEDTNANDPAVKTMDNMFRNYSNFFLFRQFVSHHDEYVSTISDEERKTIGERKKSLDGYISAYKSKQSEGVVEQDKAAVVAVLSMRQQLGLTDEKLSLGRAKEELELPAIDEARRTELTAYVAKAKAVDEAISGEGFIDEAWIKDQAAMQAKYGDILTKAGIKLADYKEKLDELAKLKNLEKPQQAIRSGLSSLHQEYVAAMKAHQGRFGRERDARLKQLNRPHDIADYKVAERILNADTSPKRREALTQYIELAPEVEKQARASTAEKTLALLGDLKKPDGVKTLDDAVRLKTELEAMEEFKFCPPDDPETCEIAKEIAGLIEKRNTMLTDKSETGLIMLDRNFKKLNSERSQLAKSWDGLWKRGLVSSAKLKDYDKQFDAKETVYKELYLNFEDASRKWLRGLKNSGQLNAANVVKMTPDLLEKRGKYYAAKAEFEKFRDEGDTLRWTEAIAGHLTGAEADVAAATEAAQKIWGTSLTQPSAESLVARIREVEKQLEAKRTEESILSQTLSRSQWEYSQKMVEKGIKLPFVITRVAIREALDLPYNDLITRLRAEPALMAAFRNTLDQWSKYLSTLRVESQTKDAGNY
ncbi:MAG: alpha/beta fold hydrolase [Bdellovibrionales bacterium]